MSQSKQVYIHVGRSRSLSVYLQSVFFPYLEDTYFEGNDRSPENPISVFCQRLMTQHPLTLDFDLHKKNIDRYLMSIPESKVVLSYESFDGVAIFNHRDQKVIMDGLKEVFPDAKIIFFFRRQDRWLESMYKTMLYFGLSMSFKNFINYKNGVFEQYQWKKIYNLEVKDLNYLKMIQYYEKIFGKQNVLALPFEKFKKTPDQFMEQLTNFFGTKLTKKVESYAEVNRQFSMLSYFFARVLNRFLIKPFNSFGLIPEQPFLSYFSTRRKNGKLYHYGFAISKRLKFGKILRMLDQKIYIPYKIVPEELQDKILTEVEKSNRELADYLNEPLEEYGYFKS